MSYNPTDKVKKYILVGRKSTIINLDPNGEDKTTFSTEIFMLKPNTQMNGMFYEYQRAYYRDGRRGTDCGLEEGKMYPSFDGTLQDFVDLNFKSDVNVTHDISIMKTYPNKNFMKRDRKTTYHDEYNIDLEVDADGKGFVKKTRVGGTNQSNTPDPTANFINNDVFFHVMKDTSGVNKYIVVFGMEHEIQDDSIVGDLNHVANMTDAFEQVGTFCGDDGSMCEDYLVAVTNKVTPKAIKAFAKTLGLKESKRLKNIGWG